MLSRRDLVVRGMGAAFALSAGGLLMRPPRTLAKDVFVELHSCNGVKPMFDVARDCPFSGFELADHKPLSPAPVINAVAEDVLRIEVRNEKAHAVGFTIEGLGRAGHRPARPHARGRRGEPARRDLPSTTTTSACSASSAPTAS